MGTGTIPSQIVDSDEFETLEALLGLVPRPIDSGRASLDNAAQRHFLMSRAQLAHIQPGTMSEPLKVLCPVRSMIVSAYDRRLPTALSHVHGTDVDGSPASLRRQLATLTAAHQGVVRLIGSHSLSLGTRLLTRSGPKTERVSSQGCPNVPWFRSSVTMTK